MIRRILVLPHVDGDLTRLTNNGRSIGFNGPFTENGENAAVREALIFRKHDSGVVRLDAVRGNTPKSLGRLVSDHVVFLGVPQPGQERRDGVWTGKLAKDVGNLVTEEGAAVPEPIGKGFNSLFGAGTKVTEGEHGAVSLEEREGSVEKVGTEGRDVGRSGRRSGINSGEVGTFFD